MADIVFGIRLTADGSGYTGTVRMAAAETEKLGNSARRAGSEGIAQLEGSMRSAVVAGQLLGQGIAFLARKLAEWIGESVSAAAALKDWSDATGSSVETLSRMSNAARLSGLSQDMLRVGTERLAYSLANSDEESKRATKSLAALGITTRDPAEAFVQLANKLNEYADGSNKAALVQDIMGRGAQRLLPVLKDLAERHSITATMTREEAARAEELQKSYRGLQIGADRLRDNIAQGLIPILQRLIDQFNAGISAAGGFWNALNLLSTLPRIRSIDDVQKALAGLDAELADLDAKAKSPVSGFLSRIGIGPSEESVRASINVKRKFLTAELERLKKEMDKETERIFGSFGMSDRGLGILGGGTYKPEAPRIAQTTPAGRAQLTEFQKLMEGLGKIAIDTQAEMDAAFDHTRISKAQQALNAFIGAGGWKSLSATQKLIAQNWVDWLTGIENDKNALVAFDGVMVGLKQSGTEAQTALDQLFSTEKITKAEASIVKLMESPAWDQMTFDQQVAVLNQININIAIEETTEHVKEWAAASADYAKQRKDEFEEFLKQQDDATKWFDDERRNLEIEAQTMGMTTEARQRYIAMLILEDQRAQGLIRTDEELIARQRELTEAFNNRDSARAITDIRDRLTDGLLDAFESGKRGWKSMLDAFKDILSHYVFRPIIQAIMSPVAGMFGSMLSGATTGGTDFLTNAGGSVLGNVASGGSFNPLEGFMNASAFTSNLFAQGAENFAIATGWFSESAIAFEGAMGTLGAAVPYIGAAIAVASMFGLFDNEPSQVRGRVAVVPTGTGAGVFEDRAVTRSPFGDIGFPDEATQYFSGEAAKVFGGMIAGAFTAIASRLTPEQIATTTTRVQALQLPGAEGEYTTEDFLKMYSGQVLPTILAAALEDLDPALAKLVGQFTGSADAIVEFTNNLLALHDAIGGDLAADVEKAWKASTQGIVATVADQRKEVARLVQSYDGSAEATATLAGATLAYRTSLMQLLVQIKQVTQSIRDMFAGTRETLTTYGMSGRELYDYYRNQANSAMQQLATSTDPAEIARLSERVNTSINAAFNALPEAQRPAAANALLAYLNQVDEFVATRLTTLGQNAIAEGEDTFATVQTALNNAAGIMVNAANTQDAAGRVMLSAANTIDRAATKFAANGGTRGPVAPVYRRGEVNA